MDDSISMVATGSSEGEAGTRWAALAGVTAALAMFGAGGTVDYGVYEPGWSVESLNRAQNILNIGHSISMLAVPKATRLSEIS